jgi:hypothetical protein
MSGVSFGSVQSAFEAMNTDIYSLTEHLIEEGIIDPDKLKATRLRVVADLDQKRAKVTQTMAELMRKSENAATRQYILGIDMRRMLVEEYDIDAEVLMDRESGKYRVFCPPGKEGAVKAAVGDDWHGFGVEFCSEEKLPEAIQEGVSFGPPPDRELAEAIEEELDEEGQLGEG